jgi:WhiB family redox-sensing transcriptional regulator
MALALPGLLEPALPSLPRAACLGMDPRLFYPDRGDADTVARAVAVCASCPEKAPCREWAVAHPAERGVWGGTTDLARRRIRANGGRVVVAALDDIDEPDADALAELEEPTSDQWISHAKSTVEEPAADMSESPHAVNGANRACVGCGEPLSGPDSKRWCSQACRSRHKPRTAGGARTSKRLTGTNETPEAAVLETRSQVPGISTLIPAGATIVKVEYLALGDTWTLTRSSTNGGPS